MSWATWGVGLSLFAAACSSEPPATTAAAGSPASGQAGSRAPEGRPRADEAHLAGLPAAPAPEARPKARAPAPPTGYTQLKPSPDSRRIHVSSAAGDDRNDGRSPEAPVKTLARGRSLLRSGHPDWLLLRRGDTFEGGLGQWKKSGRSQAEPMVVWSYGPSKRRPLLRVIEGGALLTNGGGGSPTHIDHLAVVGLEFYAARRDPASPVFAPGAEVDGVNWLRGTRDLLIEDCVFRFFPTAVVIQNFDKQGISNVRLRHNQFLDSWSTNNRAQGLYVSGVDGITIEGNLFDHNGSTDPRTWKPTIFAHNLYVQNGTRGVVVRDNIFLRGSSHGAQLRGGGVAEFNLFVRNPIALLIGGGDEPDPGGVRGEVRGNVILEGTNIGPQNPRGWGIELENIRDAEVRDNVVAHMLDGGMPRGIASHPKARYAGNVVYRWAPEEDMKGPFADPERSVERYNALQGGKASFEDFARRLRQTSRLTPQPPLSARAITRWIRQGFAPAP